MKRNKEKKNCYNLQLCYRDLLLFFSFTVEYVVMRKVLENQEGPKFNGISFCLCW